MVRVKKWAFLGPKSRFLAQKSDFCHMSLILVDNPFVALGETVHFPPQDRPGWRVKKSSPIPTVGAPSASKSPSAGWTIKQKMNNCILSQHHWQASLLEDAQELLLLCQRHPRPAKTKGEMWYIKCQQLEKSWNRYFWGQSVINRCKYSRKKIIWIFIGILLLLTFLIQIYSVFRLS